MTDRTSSADDRPATRVSRETPPAPAVARGVFPRRLDLMERYAELLAGEGVRRGLLGPREAPRIWERHLLNCGVLAQGCAPGASLADVGTGAGLPGVVLAISRPDLEVTLVEPLLRRTAFLSEVIAELGLDNAEVVRARAEELRGKRTFDIVASRAVAPLARLLDWCLPLVAPEGVVLAMKGASATDELSSAEQVLRRHRAGPAEVLTFGAGVLAPPTTVVRVPGGSSRR